MAKRFHELGFEVTATRGTAGIIRAEGVPSKKLFKANEGWPNAVDLLKAGGINLIICTATSDAHAFSDEKAIQSQGYVTYLHPMHHHHERNPGLGRGDHFAEARADSRMEPAGDPWRGGHGENK